MNNPTVKLDLDSIINVERLTWFDCNDNNNNNNIKIYTNRFIFTWTVSIVYFYTINRDIASK